MVEDSIVNQKVAVGLLAKEHHDMTVVDNGKAAVELLKGEGAAEFDLVLMDVQMPEMDGVTATRLIRDDEQKTQRRMPILAMTAHAMKGDRERFLEAGMDEYLTKPLRSAELFEAIVRICPLAQRRSPATVADPTPPPDQPTSDKVSEWDTTTVDKGTVNWEEALRAMGDDRNLLLSVVDAFLEECPRRLEEIQGGLEQDDRELMRRAAHTLKGASLHFGAHASHRAASALEQAIVDETNDIPESIGHLQENVARLLEELRRYSANFKTV